MNRHWTDRLRFWMFRLRAGTLELLGLCLVPLRWLHPRSLAAGLAEWWNLLAAPFRLFRREQLQSELIRDTRDAVATGTAVVTNTGGTIASTLGLIVRLPWYAAVALVRLPGRAWWYVRTRTRTQLALGSLLVIAAGFAFGWPAFAVIREMRIENLRREQYRQLNLAFGQSNYSQAKHNLTVLRDVTPHDDKIAARLNALETGEAPADDSQLCHLLIRYHAGRGDLKAAAREAEKLIVHESYNWEARLILADRAYRAGDRDAAALHLAAMPSAVSAGGIELWAVLYGSRLFRELGERDRLDDLLEYMGDRLVPFIRSSQATMIDPAARCQLIDCFNQVLAHLDRRPTLKAFWVPVQKLCHSVATAEGVTPPLLAYLGTLQEAHLDALQALRRHGLIKDDELPPLVGEVEDRLTQIWKRLHELDANHPLAYLGQATHLCRRGQFQEALRRLDEGLRVCGPTSELVATKARILRDHDPAGGIRFLDAALSDTTLTLPLCRVIADAATVARRPDKVIEACRKARELKDEQAWTYRLEAEALLNLNRATEAAAALRNIPAAVVTDPPTAALYVRALCGCGAVGLADQFLERMAAERRSALVIAAGADALAKLGHLPEALKHARQAVNRDQTSAAARGCLADILVLTAATETGYDRALAEDAIREYRKILIQAPGNLLVSGNLAWLELKALNLADQAFATSAPLRAVESPGLPAELLETLGAVYLSQKEYDAARRCLEWAIASGGPRPSYLTHLALAYHGLSRTEQAEQCLERAEAMPRTPREWNELVAARDAIRRDLRR